MLNTFPKYFTNKAMLIYIALLVIINIYFFSQLIPLVWAVFGIVEVMSFFYFSSRLSYAWHNYSNKVLIRQLFVVSLLIRLIWVLFSYYFYIWMTGQPFEFSAGDAYGYHNEAIWLKGMLLDGNIKPYIDYIKTRYSDMGYPFYLGLQYMLTDGSILIARIIKAILSALTVVLIFKVAERTFNRNVGFLSALFAMLMPNLIYYTGLHLKETEMLFLVVFFIERVDYLLRMPKVNIFHIFIPVILASSLFLFRTVLGATSLFAFASVILLAEGRFAKIDKRIITAIWVTFAVVVLFVGGLANEVEEVWNNRVMNQEQSMEWRSVREGGNAFAKYATGAVFMPLIFTIPFPTMVEVAGQENLMLLHGGYFVKNILAFFVIFSVFIIIKNRDWRKSILLSSFLVTYLVILALSSFAHSERFHIPALPFELIFAAYGITQFSNKYKRFFTFYLVFISIAIIGWSWFKLAGRGLG